MTYRKYPPNELRQISHYIPSDFCYCFPEGTLKVYCKEVGIQYQESMVNWGHITTEQKDVYRHRLDYVPDVAIPFIGKALNSKEFQQGRH